MSHAVRSQGGPWVVFDPIPLVDPVFEGLLAEAPVEAIVLTNGNHERAAAIWRDRCRCPVWGPAGGDWLMSDVRPASAEGQGPQGWRPVSLPGGVAGETAWRLDSADLVVFGDAIVNLASRGLDLLPDKYCTSPWELRASLGRLLEVDFETALFAHGEPLPARAADQIRGLLGDPA